MDKGKKRLPKTSRQQYEIYLYELENNSKFRENKFSPEEPNFLKDSWDKLVKKLSSFGGPIKDVGAWKRTFSDCKAHVRKRARDSKYAQKATGNFGEPVKSLSDIELRLLQITGKIVVDGLPVSELGVETEETVVEKEQEETEEEAPEPPRKKKGSLIQYVKDIAEGLNTANSSSQSNSSEDIVAVLKSMDKKMDLLIDN